MTEGSSPCDEPMTTMPLSSESGICTVLPALSITVPVSVSPLSVPEPPFHPEMAYAATATTMIAITATAATVFQFMGVESRVDIRVLRILN